MPGVVVGGKGSYYLINGYKISGWEDKKNADGQWWQLHKKMNILNDTKL